MATSDDRRISELPQRTSVGLTDKIPASAGSTTYYVTVDDIARCLDTNLFKTHDTSETVTSPWGTVHGRFRVFDGPVYIHGDPPVLIVSGSGIFQSLIVGDVNSHNLQGNYASILGGTTSNVSGDFSAVAAGSNQLVTGQNNFIGGGSGNLIIGESSTIGGGTSNQVTGQGGMVAGGVGNRAYGDFSFVGGGQYNLASGQSSAVGAGEINQAIGAGAFVGGGALNQANGTASTIAGGYLNKTNGAGSFIGGGIGNNSTGQSSVLLGGDHNVLSGDDSVLIGGVGNIAVGAFNFMGDGNGNRITGQFDSIINGQRNVIVGNFDTIGNGNDNSIYADYSFIGDGAYNRIEGSGNFIGAGQQNISSGKNSFVGGGKLNRTIGLFNTVGGGSSNYAGTGVANSYNVVGGGVGNIAASNYSFVGGGSSNQSWRDYGLILGGSNNIVNASWGTILGGDSNAVSGEFGLAWGRRAKNAFRGASLLTDSTNSADKYAVNNDTMTMTFANGVFISGCRFHIHCGFNPPQTQKSPGCPGAIEIGGQYLYICTGIDQWGRINADWLAANPSEVQINCQDYTLTANIELPQKPEVVRMTGLELDLNEAGTYQVTAILQFYGTEVNCNTGIVWFHDFTNGSVVPESTRIFSRLGQQANVDSEHDYHQVIMSSLISAPSPRVIHISGNWGHDVDPILASNATLPFILQHGTTAHYLKVS